MLKLDRFSCSQKILFKWDPPVLIFSYHWETLHEPHCEQCWVKLTHASHVILQQILYKLWSKTLTASFPTPSIANSNTTVASSSKSYPEKWCHTPYLILRNMQEILHFLFLLTFSYPWETLYKPHCQQCWVKFSHASHVILQLKLYKLWSKTLTTSFPTPSIANSDITVVSNWKS